MGGACPRKEEKQIFPARSEEKVRLADDRSLIGGKGATSINHSLVQGEDFEAHTNGGGIRNEMSVEIAAKREAEAVKAVQEKKIAEEKAQAAAAKAALAKQEADKKKAEEEAAKLAAKKAAEERRALQEAAERAEAERKKAIESGNKKAAEEAEKQAAQAKQAALQAEKIAKEKSDQAQKAGENNKFDQVSNEINVLGSDVGEASAKAAVLRANEEAANQAAAKKAKRQQEKEAVAKAASRRAAELMARRETLAKIKQSELANIQKFVKEKQDLEAQSAALVEQKRQNLN